MANIWVKVTLDSGVIICIGTEERESKLTARIVSLKPLDRNRRWEPPTTDTGSLDAILKFRLFSCWFCEYRDHEFLAKKVMHA
jgi:hypothetical protein